MTARLEERLASIVLRYWRVPQNEGKRLVRVLLQSPCSRARVFRHQLSLTEVPITTAHGQCQPDLSHTYAHVVTPHFMMALVQDLHVTGSLTAKQAQGIEEALLTAVDREGRWRAV